jgi:hypothetical protein
MDRAPQLANAPRVVRILHTALLGGLILSGAMLYLVRRVLQPPSVGEAHVLTLVLAVVPAVLLVIAVGAPAVAFALALAALVLFRPGPLEGD